MKGSLINSFDGTPIFVRVWDEVDNPIGIVQICHGMCEHSGRYFEFAELLNKNGYIVFADDHRCYGLSEPPHGIGHHEGKIFEDTLKDLIFFNRYFKELYELPVFFFGHSYGSFLAQAFLESGERVQGMILAGTAYMGKAVPSLGATLASLLPQKAQPALFLKMSDLLFNGRFSPEKGPCIWSTSDTEKRQSYLNDPMCNIPPSISFYKNMLKGLQGVAKKDNLKKIDLSTPVAIFSGRSDPIGGNKSSKAISLYKLLRKRGLKTLRLFIYEDARHELINETGRELYMQHMLSFINRCFNVEKSPF